MRVPSQYLSRHRRSTLWISALIAAFALNSGCEIDPDDDYPRPPVVPTPDDGKGDGTDDPNNPPDDTNNPPDDSNNPDDPIKGGACFGHCDCLESEYCATVGTCQPRFSGAPYYCCDRTDHCPEGAQCHIPDTENELGVCGE